jgi:ribosomal protein S18 acetylase RimI-like enzyme
MRRTRRGTARSACPSRVVWASMRECPPAGRRLARSQFGAFARGLGPVPWHDASVPIAIRPAETSDEDALTRIEQETSSLEVSPILFPPRPFFENARPEEVLVAVLDDEVAGFLRLRPATPWASNEHVLMIAGLAVMPSAQRKGVASALLEAAEAYASERKVERLTLRVLSVNTAALALYERHGYETEGELRGEFRLPVGPGGAVVQVDDVLLAKAIEPSAPTDL